MSGTTIFVYFVSRSCAAHRSLIARWPAGPFFALSVRSFIYLFDFFLLGPFLAQRMVRICYAYVALRFVTFAYPLPIPCVSLAPNSSYTFKNLMALWHFGTFVFWMRFLGFLRLSSLNSYYPTTYKVSSKSHRLKFSPQNPINPIFLSHYLSLFRSACSFSD